jgi:hypothetical protein
MQVEAHEVAITDSFLITKEFASAEAFSVYIEDRAITEGESLIDTILAYCDERDIDVDVTAKLVTKSLKEKLALEFEERNMLRVEHGTLDL